MTDTTQMRRIAETVAQLRAEQIDVPRKGYPSTVRRGSHVQIRLPLTFEPTAKVLFHIPLDNAVMCIVVRRTPTRLILRVAV